MKNDDSIITCYKHGYKKGDRIEIGEFAGVVTSTTTHSFTLSRTRFWHRIWDWIRDKLTIVVRLWYVLIK